MLNLFTAKAPLHFRSLPALVALSLCFVAAVRAQAPAPVLATITFADGQSATVGSTGQQTFLPIDILPGEALGIELRLPVNFVNTPVALQPMDGGFAPEEIEIAQDGSTNFAFQAGTQPGLYRILLATRNSSVLLQFSVPNPGTP